MPVVLSPRLLLVCAFALLAGVGTAFAASAAKKGGDTTATIYFTAPRNFDVRADSAQAVCLPKRAVTLRKVPLRRRRQAREGPRPRTTGGPI